MSADSHASGGHPQAASLVGETLDGRYRIIRKLGEGGMGEVYAAEHIHIEKRFAIKLLRQEIVSNPEAVQRFRQEARSSSSIGHRNIIAIEDFGQLPDGRIYMCMELLNGAALNDLITTPQPVDRLLNILIQTGHGLAAAHAKGIVHRDMKPENVFVTIDANNQDIPKILDFGIAKVAGNDGQNNLTRTGTIFGTPFYMAPEQALGNPVDARTDIYAMGVIMYEVFAGSLPFQGESFMGILTQHITTEPEPIEARAAKAGRPLPAGIAEVVMRCLRKNPAERFATMDELVTALVPIYRSVAGAGMSTYMEAFPVSARMPAPTPPPLTGAHPGYQPPPTGPTPQYGQGHPPPPPHGPQTPVPYVPGPSGSTPAASASGLYDPSGSVVVPPKSKVGLIIAIFVVLAIGGGVTAFLLTRDPGTTPSDPVVQNDPDNGTGASGSAPVTNPPVDAQSGGTNPVSVDAGSTVVASGGIDAGGTVAVATPDAGSAETPAPDAGGTVAVATPDAAEPPPVDAAPEPPKPVNVVIQANASKFDIYENGKKVSSSGKMLSIIPGETHTYVIKAKNYEDAEITVDGSEQYPTVTLKKKEKPVKNPPDPQLPVDPPPPKLDCSTKVEDKKNAACIKQFCRNPANVGTKDASKFCLED